MIGSNFNALMNPGAITTTPNMNVGGMVPVLSNRPAWAPQGVYADGLKGFGQHLGDALKEPGMAHALLRGAAASFEGKGIGGALDAASGSMDQTHGIQRQQDQQNTENALADRLEALKELTQQQQNDVANQGLGIDRGRLGETVRSNMAGEDISRRGQDVQRYGIDTGASTARRGQDVDRANTLTSASASMSNAGTAASASRYGSGLDFIAATDPGVLSARYGGAAGIGSKGMPILTQKVPASSSGGFLGFGATKTPGYTLRTPLPPGVSPDAVLAGGRGGAIGKPEVRYGPDGKAYVKDPATGKPVPYTGG